MVPMTVPSEKYPDDLMTLSEAAEEFSEEKRGRFRGVKSAETIRSWHRSKQIKFYRIGASKVWLVSRKDMEECLRLFVVGDGTAEG